MEQRKINYSLLLTICITILGWGVTFGTCKNKIDTNARDIQRVEQQQEKEIKKINERQDNSEILLQSINAQLIELNTKITLLLKGDLKVGK
jgi:Tfp pilus assembly protein PilO